MASRVVGGILSLIVLVLGGCATPPLPGAAGEVRGALRSIELYVGFETRVPYRTVWRDRLFASDRQVWVGLYWDVPAPGTYAAKVTLWTPTGTLHGDWEARFRAESSPWFTGQNIALPHDTDAQGLAGAWQVEVSLDGVALGRRTFTLDPGSIRLRTDARVAVVQETDDPEMAAGDWTWLNRAAALEAMKQAHTALGNVLRDELARRFPHVEGPRQAPAGPDATLLVQTRFAISPNPDTDARLVLDVVHVPTQARRTFQFRSSAGIEQLGATRQRDNYVAAAHLAFQATASPEVLEFLMTTTQAVPE